MARTLLKKKIYIGQGLKYCSKSKVGEFKIEGHTLKKGDRLLITGPTTGVIELDAEEVRVNNEAVNLVEKGTVCTFTVKDKIRPSDKLYKIVEA